MSCYWSFWCVFGHMRFRLYKSLNRLGHWPAMQSSSCCSSSNSSSIADHAVLHSAALLNHLFCSGHFSALAFLSLEIILHAAHVLRWRETYGNLLETSCCDQKLLTSYQGTSPSMDQDGRTSSSAQQATRRQSSSTWLSKTFEIVRGFNAGSSCITSTACRFAAMP